nr:DUF4760 domain-containing protein [Vibrio diabolicus]
MLVFSILYLSFQLSIIRRVYIQEIKAKQMERTLKAIDLPPSVTRTMGEVFHRYYTGNVEEFFRDSKLANSLFTTLNTLDNLSAGILSGAYNEEVAYTQLGNSLPKFYEIIQLFIYESRGDFSSASQYIKLEQLARRWSDKSPIRGSYD